MPGVSSCRSAQWPGHQSQPPLLQPANHQLLLDRSLAAQPQPGLPKMNLLPPPWVRLPPQLPPPLVQPAQQPRPPAAAHLPASACCPRAASAPTSCSADPAARSQRTVRCYLGRPQQLDPSNLRLTDAMAMKETAWLLPHLLCLVQARHMQSIFNPAQANFLPFATQARGCFGGEGEEG